jgi:hypothetical protein
LFGIWWRVVFLAPFWKLNSHLFWKLVSSAFTRCAWIAMNYGKQTTQQNPFAYVIEAKSKRFFLFKNYILVNIWALCLLLTKNDNAQEKKKLGIPWPLLTTFEIIFPFEGFLTLPSLCEDVSIATLTHFIWCIYHCIFFPIFAACII